MHESPKEPPQPKSHAGRKRSRRDVEAPGEAEGRSGLVSHVTPESAGWTYVGFDLHELKPGQTASANTGDREVCLVFVTGKGKACGRRQGARHARRTQSPFDGRPWSVYVPAGFDWSVTAETELELAVCSAPGLGGGLPARVIAPDDVETGGARQGHQHALRHKHPARGRAGRFAAGRGGDHAGRPYVELSAAQARPGQSACANPIWRRPIIIGSTRRRVLPSSVSTRTTTVA